MLATTCCFPDIPNVNVVLLVVVIAFNFAVDVVDPFRMLHPMDVHSGFCGPWMPIPDVATPLNSKQLLEKCLRCTNVRQLLFVRLMPLKDLLLELIVRVVAGRMPLNTVCSHLVGT